MNISIIGSGYVGLVSGVCLAEKGHQVTCVDIDQEKIDKINRASSPIYERGLNELLKKNVGRKLTATTDLRRSVFDTDITMINDQSVIVEIAELNDVQRIMAGY